VSINRAAVSAETAPEAIGPYSHAVRINGLLFCSGQIPLDPTSGEIIGSSAAEQARRCLQNLEAVCAAGDTSLKAALRLTIYTTDLGKFDAINDVYSDFFDTEPPARTAVEVAALPKGALVEIDAIVGVG
jgi:2-iminobutanoate/2-iminopropanoate deaminase